jgi:hypothetical protein
VEDANGVAAAFLSVQDNKAPAGGTVLAFPQSGMAMDTEFGFVAESWADADPPLSYRFTVQVKGQEGQPVQLQDFSPLPEYKAGSDTGPLFG